MSSTNTDDQPEKQRDWQSADSLAQQNSAVSPLLDNIIGGADRFAAAVDVSVTSEQPSPSLDKTIEQLNDSEPLPGLADGSEAAAIEESDSSPKLQQPRQGTELESSAQLEGAKSSLEQEHLSLSEQYGDAGLLAELNALAQTQQFQLEQHREYVLRSRAEQGQQIKNWQERCAALEEQLEAARDRVQLLEQRHLASQSQLIPLEVQREAAQKVTESLQTEILDRRQRQATLEEQLDSAEATLREQQEISAAQSQGIVAMQAELSQAQAEVEALETRLSHQDHLRQQLKADGNRDRQDRSKARDRQLQLEQETTQMTGQLLRLSEELRQAQHQSKQWRRQAQTQSEQLREIAHWAAEAESVPPELMALLEPLFNSPDPIEESPPSLSPETSPTMTRQVESSNPAASNPTDIAPSSLDLPNFPHGNV